MKTLTRRLATLVAATLGALVIVAPTASYADFGYWNHHGGGYHQRARQELGHDRTEFRRDQRELWRDQRAHRWGEVAQDRRELWNDRRELQRDAWKDRW